MRFKESFDLSTLCKLYDYWLHECPSGRNKNDLRFGQYIVNAYLKEGETFPELFYMENMHMAYMIARYEILEGDGIRG